MLEEELDLDECYRALSKMPAQKSPGTDKLPAEFYTMCWDTLGRDLVDVINFSNSQNLLAKSMRSTILTLAFKGKDPGGGVMTFHAYGYLPPEFLKSYPVSE